MQTHVRSGGAIAALVLVALAGSAQAGIVQGPSSSATPYLVPVPMGPNITVHSIITAGDSVNFKADGVTPYRFVGVPDGIGAYDNGDGTATLVVNHELVPSQGIGRDVSGPGGLTTSRGGSFVSQWVINTSAGANFLRVNNGRDLDTTVVTSTNGPGTGSNATNANTFSRYCSGDLALQSAFYNASSGLGTQERIYLNGEEAGTGSRAMAHVISERTGYQLTRFDGTGSSWENLLARPYESDMTVVNSNSDGGTNRIYTYIGTKTNSGQAIDRAGLTNGTNYSIQVRVNGVNVNSEGAGSTVTGTLPLGSGFGGGVLSGTFALVTGNAGTSFQRPEDGAWDPSHPNDYYFVTTDRLDTVRDGIGTQAGRSRLWRMRYSDINNPLAGGTIEALLDGTEGQNMLDNICVVPGVDGHSRIIALEDVGNAAHNGKVWMYDTATDVLTLALQHDPARFGDVGLLPTAPFTYDKESSGVIDARDTLGLGWFFVDVQDHQIIPGELAEGGQLLAFYYPGAIPTPGAATLAIIGGVAAARRRRR